MSDPDELDDAQVAAFAQQLRDLTVSVGAELNRDSDTADTVDLDQPIGRLSRMDAIQQQRMAQAQRLRLRIRLGQIRQALAAVDDDEYGECRSCGDFIGLRRLSVRPEAPLCIPCTESMERRQR